MGQDPSQIRQDIEQTREQMGDTVEALGHKTDVPGTAKEAISGKVEPRQGLRATPDSGRSRTAPVRQPASPGEPTRRDGMASARRLLVPSTKVEDEKIGPIADQVKEKAKETGQEAIERGKQVASRRPRRAARRPAASRPSELKGRAPRRRPRRPADALTVRHE